MLIVALTLFVLAVAFQIHGSSIAVWKDLLRDPSSRSGLLFSTPKAVRTDEWLAWTPSVLAQALHDPPFPVENPNIGAGKSPLLVNLPARHYGMLFRPQLYGFFLFDLETGYAFYWNVKAFGLFLAFFFLFRKLTRDQFWLAFFGAGWVWFSAYIQWWFSCPPMMPEMLASWAIAIGCVLFLFDAARPVLRILATVALVVAGANFALCFYPPFQIPFVYLGIAVLGGWFWQNRKTNLSWRAALWSIGVAGLGLAAVLVPYIIECKSTLDLVAGTSYPGARRSHGGDLSMTDYLNGLLGFFNWSELDFLGTRGNSSESSNFYPLWIFVLAGSAAVLWRERRERRIEVVLFFYLLVVSLYIWCPFPDWLCRWTLLNFVTGTRALLAAGIAGIVLTTMLFAKPPRTLTGYRRGALAIASIAFLVLILVRSYPGNEKYLTSDRLGLLLALNTLFIALYYFAPLKVFCGVFLFCLALNNGGVNPLSTGLGPLLESAPGAVVRQMSKSDPSAKWMAYTSPQPAQFLKAQGVNVLNGLSYVPDLAWLRQLDPAGQYDFIYNRYGLSTFIIDRGNREFRLAAPFLYGIDILPTDPALQTRGARYVVTLDEMVAPDEKGLRPLANLPGTRLWVYEVAAEQ